MVPARAPELLCRTHSLKVEVVRVKNFRNPVPQFTTRTDLSFGGMNSEDDGRMLMGNLLSLVMTIYFVAIILAVYHLQQKELDRIQQQIDENNRLFDEMQRRLYVEST
jgi:hypothetical protein